ncbi:MAG TPA: ABC transporter ATP-binding protein [Beijerinckiaceae bacterium]|nr:ABC transporter ATP-binding protein [Beijerinckiaceae bacterium]
MTALLQPVGIDVEGVDLAFGATQVLRNVSLSVHPGEFFAFLGPSGCGKTTLLRLIAGFNVAQKGRVLIGGRDVTALPPWRRDVGMVFQSYALWPHMSVARNVAFGLEERRLPRSEVAGRVDEALDLVGLRHLKDRKPSQLSGGQQQRVALARTIAVRPQVLLLDEPLSNLDAKMRVEVRRELRELQQRLKLTTIFVTHDQEEANTICDRIAVMSEGIVQQVGAPMDLYDRPANLFVAGFLGTANFLEEGGRKVMVRPQNVQLGAEAATGAFMISGAIVHREFQGATMRYVLETERGPLIVDEPYDPGRSPYAVGSQVNAAIRPERLVAVA